jgi:hypothetical protein
MGWNTKVLLFASLPFTYSEAKADRPLTTILIVTV